MPNIKGHLHKMSATKAEPVQYFFNLACHPQAATPVLAANELLGKQFSLNFTGNINCIACNRAIPKTYQQGYCFPCAKKLAACDLCILKPENCHFHLGTCREPDWGLAHCFVPHIIYLANSSGLKIGITRESQVPTRWIDQGATQALPIMRVQSRYQAGLLEVEFAKHVADKTNWRKMLQGQAEDLDLKAERDFLFENSASMIQQIAGKFKFGAIEILTAETIQTFSYPVLEYPNKITSLDLDKKPNIQSTLLGIKGQYLLLDSGVINLRKYTGYEIELDH